VNRVEALEIFVRDTARSIAFYAEYIGAVHGHACQNGYLLTLDDGFRLRLCDAAAEAAYLGGAAPEGDSPRGQGVVLSIAVDDLDARFKQAVSQGVPLYPDDLTAPVKLPNGGRTFTLVDPDGYHVRLVESLPAAPRARSPEERFPSELLEPPVEAEA
jgi:predicted enzyme related to lactoylglutathione lyase